MIEEKYRSNVRVFKRVARTPERGKTNIETWKGKECSGILVFGSCCHVTFRDNDEVRMSRNVTLRKYKDPLGIPPGV